MKACLKELQKFIHDGKNIDTGKPFGNFNDMRFREILGNWLFCAVFSFELKTEHLMICTDPSGGDGVIYDPDAKKYVIMEHVLVARCSDPKKHIEDLILEQINNKRKKGNKAYASGKTLLIFLNKADVKWIPNRVGKKLPKELYFDEGWVVGLYGVFDGEYIYNVVKLDKDWCFIWQVTIKMDSDEWNVEQIQ